MAQNSASFSGSKRFDQSLRRTSLRRFGHRRHLLRAVRRQIVYVRRLVSQGTLVADATRSTSVRADSTGTFSLDGSAGMLDMSQRLLPVSRG